MYKLLPFEFMRKDDNYVLLTNVVGEYLFIKDEDFKKLMEQNYSKLGTQELNNLCSHQFLCADADESFIIELLANKLRSRKSYLDSFTSLHMIVLTLGCNCRCDYCQASSTGLDDDENTMTKDVARKVVDCIFAGPSHNIKIEFQGGEPSVNWEVLKFITLYAEESNKKARKYLEFVVCTNLIEVSSEQFEFLHTHNINISSSCDGTKHLHDLHRKSLISESAYDRFVDNMDKYYSLYPNDKINSLLTVTKDNLQHLREIIDHYINLKFNNIFIRALNPYGYAKENKQLLGYSAEDFVKYYKDALQYIIELNLSGTKFSESYATILLQRILTPFPTGFMDLQSPCGAGLAGAIYYPNGDVYPSDEARMLATEGDTFFRLGSVITDSYDSIFTFNKVLRTMVESSIVESMPGCATCAYNMYCGADPVRYYNESGTMYGKRYNSDFCKKNKMIFDCLFEYLQKNDPKIMKIFWSWITRR